MLQKLKNNIKSVFQIINTRIIKSKSTAIEKTTLWDDVCKLNNYYY